MKTVKFLIRILGVGFLLGGVVYFSNIFSVGGVTKNIAVLLLRLVNAIVWIATGYGLIRLNKWSLYTFGSMIVLFILTALYNLYFTTAPKEALNLTVPAVQVVILLFLGTYRNKLLEK